MTVTSEQISGVCYEYLRKNRLTLDSCSCEIKLALKGVCDKYLTNLRMWYVSVCRRELCFK